MIKKVIFTFLVFSALTAHSAFAEICIGDRCTGANSIGSVSVGTQNGHSTCSGSGCAALGFKQVQSVPSSVLKSIELNPIGLQLGTGRTHEVFRSRLRPVAGIPQQTEKSQKLLLKSYYDLHKMDGERE